MIECNECEWSVSANDGLQEVEVAISHALGSGHDVIEGSLLDLYDSISTQGGDDD